MEDNREGNMEPSSPFRIDGKIALITGGASGIGECASRIFSKAGASVIIADIDTKRAEALAAELPGSRAIHCDITSEESVKHVFQQVPRLDILLNNAGIGLVGGVTETELADFERVLKVNVTGMFLVTKHAVPLLIESHGAIVNIGSVAGQIGVRRRFGYCASKGAVLAMTRQLAVDYPTEFRVNAIAPGTVDTPFVEGYLEKHHRHEKDKVRAELNQRQPIGRLGKPEEIAHLALYLCSDEAAFVNGAVMNIDDGWTAA
jgi:2-keto-3-deoxy-L-fuconate dehydrogenase